MVLFWFQVYFKNIKTYDEIFIAEICAFEQIAGSGFGWLAAWVL